MKSVRWLLLLMCLVLLVGVPAAAQDGEWQCAPVDLGTTIADAQAQLTAAQTALDGGDIAAALDAMEEAGRLSMRARPVCSGMSFAGEGDVNTVERVTLEEGIYILEYELTASPDMFGGIFNITFEEMGEGSTIFPVSALIDAGETVTGSETIRTRTTDEYLLDVIGEGFVTWSFVITSP